MSDVEDRSFWYRFGRQLGTFTWLYLVVFGAGIAGVLFGATVVPSPLKTLVLVLSCFFGGIALLIPAVTRKNSTAFFVGIYVLLVAAGSVLQDKEPRPTRTLVVVAIASILAAMAFVTAILRRGRKNKELERLLFSESTSVAFFVTMLGAITYALLEVWVDAPKLSMWVVWTVGMGAWFVLSAILRRRYS